MFGRKIAGAAALIGSLQLVAKFLDFLSLIAFARVLTPADFGLVAIAVSVLLIANSVTELPIMDVLVQRPNLAADDIATAFTLSALRGLVAALFLMIISWPVSWLYGDSRLTLLICVIAFAPLLQGLASPAMVYFTRRIEYGPTAWAMLIGKVSSLALSLGIALWTGSYWALIIGLVSMQAATTISTHVFAPWRPQFRLAGARSILDFAGWVTISRIIWTVSIQSDRMLVGRIVGKTSLGYYSMASDISSVATYAIAGPVLGPIFSGFSRIRDDLPRLRNAYIKSQQTLVMVVLPFGIGLAAVAGSLVPLLLGKGWEPAVPVIRWLAPVIALQMMSVPVQAVAMAMGLPKTLAAREGLGLAIRLPATLIAATFFGVIGAAVARSLTGLVIIVINLVIVRGVIGSTVRSQLYNCWRSLVSASVMTAAIIEIDLILGPQIKFVPFLLAVQIPAGALFYVLTHFCLWCVRGRPDGGEQFLFDLLFRRRNIA